MSERTLVTVVRESLSEQERLRPETMWREMVSWLVIVLAAVVFALLVNRLLIVNAQVTSGSMQNTSMVAPVAFWKCRRA